MRRRTGFYSVILTSVICMLGGSAFAASSVRTLGTNGSKTVVGATNNNTTGAKSGNGVTTSAVAHTTRASSLRFASPTVSTSKTTSNSGTNNSANPSSARLSIGKYLSVSNGNKVVSGGTASGGTSSGGSASGGTSGGASSAEIGQIRTELDKVQTELDRLKDGKQAALVVGDGEYIDISGDENNVISINIEALKSDLQTALNTDKDILTEIDSNYKLWWCFANANKSACSNEKQQVIDLGQVLDNYDLINSNVSLKEVLDGKQGTLSPANNGYITISQETGTIGVDFDALQAALGADSTKTTEIQYTQDGKLQWRYMDEFENDGSTKKWRTADISALLQNSLADYVQTQTLLDYVQRSELSDLQGKLTTDSNGYIKIEGNKINVKFDELKQALNIPVSQVKVEMEITQEGKLQWRYLNDFEEDGVTKKWTVVAEDLSDVLDGKLANYIDTTDLASALQDYIDSSALTNELKDYATKTYIDGELAKKQVKLSEAEDGFISITPATGKDVIDIKMTALREALGIDNHKTSEMRIDNGALQWRYTDQFEQDPQSGAQVKSWVTIINLNTLLEDYVLKSDFNDFVTELNGKLNGKQIKLTPAANGHILLNEQTGEIAVNMNTLKEQLALDPDRAKTSEIRVDSGELQWRYLDEYDDNLDKVWHALDLSTIQLPYLTSSSLSDYYNKTEVDSLAETIEESINDTLQKLASLPEDGPSGKGLYLLSITDGDSGEKVSTWSAIQIVDGDGTVH